MKSQWSDQNARAFEDRWAKSLDPLVAQRLYTAHLIGGDASLVLHGGGNVSVKASYKNFLGEDVETIYVKASGTDLSQLTPQGLTPLDLERLRKMRQIESLTDEQLANAYRLCCLDANAAPPSIETLLHAFLPHRFVDHSHADAVLTLTNQPNGDTLIKEALGDSVGIIEYIRPGLSLAKAVANLCDSKPNLTGVVLMKHGLVTFGPDAKSSYETHIDIVDRCEAFIKQKTEGKSLNTHFKCELKPEALAEKIAPTIRGLLSVKSDDIDQLFVRPILDWRHTPEVMQFVNSKEARTLSAEAPLTGDHVIRTKSRVLFCDVQDWSDMSAAITTITQCIESFREDYKKYMQVHAPDSAHDDGLPSVVLLPGVGALCWGNTKRSAAIAADITEQTLRVKTNASLIGSYEGLTEQHLADMEFRTLQRRKICQSQGKALAGQVVAISGGAGAIGVATARCCLKAGAHVVIADLNQEALDRAVKLLTAEYRPENILAVRMDVTDEQSVAQGFAEMVRTFGGVDVIVPNAGIAHVASIESLDVAQFRRVMEINATGYLTFMQAGIRILKQQGLGGNIIINASKNVFGPGKDFGAYSASKAAGHQLGKVAAIELAPLGIRVNMINA
ncbi:bifunctional aldolase/short-chain dehydrogenase, partial [bacterium AH-315-J04]|nr:bifunctional aldolase/short-chain dehydrogenase [bacterium AH-315-J04]